MPPYPISQGPGILPNIALKSNEKDPSCRDGLINDFKDIDGFGSLLTERRLAEMRFFFLVPSGSDVFKKTESSAIRPLQNLTTNRLVGIYL